MPGQAGVSGEGVAVVATIRNHRNGSYAVRRVAYGSHSFN